MDNPQLSVESMENWRAGLLLTEKPTDHAVRIPLREAVGARIRFVDCALGEVPSRWLDAVWEKTIRIVLRNRKHVLAA